MSIELVIILLVGILSYANGANDISKGIATLVGSGVSSYRNALVWGTVSTTAGVFVAARFSSMMVETFTNGVFLTNIPATVSVLAIVFGASMWILFAARIGMPVSTTHALVGSMIGIMIFSTGAVHSNALTSFVTTIIAPLLISPIVAFTLAYLFNKVLRTKLENLSSSCVCMTEHRAVFVPAFGNRAFSESAQVVQIGMREVPVQRAVFTGSIKDCIPSPGTVRFGILDAAHYVSAGLTSFARGLNDAPKILPFLLLTPAIQIPPLYGYVYIALAMALGGLIASRRVIDTMSVGITRVSHTNGFLANLMTSLLVGGGAWFGLPMSTTHVSASAIVGAGVSQGRAVSWKTIRDISIAWLVTVPVSGAMAIGAAFILKQFIP